MSRRHRDALDERVPRRVVVVVLPSVPRVGEVLVDGLLRERGQALAVVGRARRRAARGRRRLDPTPAPRG